MEEDQELERKAIEELLKEAKRGKTRAETMGPMGWMKCPLAGANKRFLINTIKNTLPSHKEQDPEPKEATKAPAKSQSRKEEHRKGHRGHPYKPSSQGRGARGGPSPPPKRSSPERGPARGPARYEKRSDKRKMPRSPVFPSPQKEEESVCLVPSRFSIASDLMPGCSQIITRHSLFPASWQPRKALSQGQKGARPKS
uniref:RNA polymerase I and III subunit D n=2 Tax=Felis catus TaxID=9685 RepID=A0ABI7YL01_FELCA